MIHILDERHALYTRSLSHSPVPDRRFILSDHQMFTSALVAIRRKDTGLYEVLRTRYTTAPKRPVRAKTLERLVAMTIKEMSVERTHPHPHPHP